MRVAICQAIIVSFFDEQWQKNELPHVWAYRVKGVSRQPSVICIFFRSFLNRQETQLSLIKTARSTRLDVSQGHQTYSTIRYVRYGFILMCYRNHVCKTQCFWGIRLQKCRDLENRVKGLWRWLKLWPFIRQFVCFPAWGLTTLSAQRGYNIISCHRRMKYILCRAGGTHRDIDKPKKRKI